MLSNAKRGLLRRLQQRKTRERERAWLAEGVRCATTVLHARARIRFAVVAAGLETAPEGRDLRDEIEAAGVELFELPASEFHELAATRTPQGVLLVCEEPDPPERLAGSRFLVLDGVQDPGNVGTLIRVAAGFGADAVLALDGTADPWSPKAVRASAGYVATLPVLAVPWDQARLLLAPNDVRLLAAAGEGDDVARVEPPERWALVLGNEGSGVRSEIASAAWGQVGVPLAGGVDSLNVGVAGAILLYALSEARRPAGQTAPGGGEPSSDSGRPR